MDNPAHDRAAAAIRGIDSGWDAVRTEWVMARAHRTRRRRRAMGATLSVLAAAGAIVMGISVPWSALSPFEATSPSAPLAAPAANYERVIRFADGSRVEPIEDARVIVSEVRDERVAVRLERGAIEVEVTPRSTREFVIDVGAVQVLVLGTAFHVHRLPDDRVAVSVDRGRVRVQWSDDAAELGAGSTGIYPPVSVAEPSAMAESDAPHPSLPARARARASSGARLERWRSLAERGEYAAAFESLEREGAAAVRDDVEELLLAADAARLSGHAARALPWLERIERHHSRDPRSALASFTRGRILMSLGRPEEAAQVFERIISRETAGSLSEDALARAIEAHHRAGNVRRVGELGSRYLARFPTGRWKNRVEELIGGSE